MSVPAVSATRVPTKSVSLSTIDRLGTEGCSAPGGPRMELGGRSMAMADFLGGLGCARQSVRSRAGERRELGDPQIGAAVWDQRQFLERSVRRDRALGRRCGGPLLEAPA